jgi:hypothetical protein
MSTHPAPPSPWLAKLDRGTIYVLVTGPSTELRFERGVAVPVSDAIREHLEENAFERRVICHDPEEDEMEIVERCEFTFEPNAPEEAAP